MDGREEEERLGTASPVLPGAPLGGHSCLGEEMNHLQGWLAAADLHPSPSPSPRPRLLALPAGVSPRPGMGVGVCGRTLGVTSTYKLDRIEMQMGFLGPGEQASLGNALRLACFVRGFQRLHSPGGGGVSAGKPSAGGLR